MMTVDLANPCPRVQIGGPDHRLLLAERWSAAPMLGWVGMNPSDAGDEKTDPTWSRSRGFTERWGFGGLIWMNPVPFRSPSPEDAIRRLREIANGRDPAGADMMRENLATTAEHAGFAEAWIIGWGDKGAAMNDAFRCHRSFLAALKLGGQRRLLTFNYTASRNPMHILARGKARLSDDALPFDFIDEERRIFAPVDMADLARAGAR